MVEYKYISYEANKKVDEIIKELEDLAAQGWELKSHSHSGYGMSVILERFKG
jgi:hypothetical protein